MYGENGELEYGGSLKNFNKPIVDFGSDDYVIEQFAPSNQPTRQKNGLKKELQNKI